jgi:hypothetical protein
MSGPSDVRAIAEEARDTLVFTLDQGWFLPALKAVERMGLTGSVALLREPARRIRQIGDTGLDEDWTLVLLGIAVLVVTIGLAVLAAWTVHQRDAALQNATVAGQRLDVGGLDNQLYQHLVDMQQDEVALFRSRLDPSQALAGHDPATDLARVESDLTALKAQFGGSAQVQRDISLITQEMAPYTSLEASALDYNQQGLPVGAGYLREASGYLTDHVLPTADDIRQVDQAQVSADDAAAGAVPWALLAVVVIGLACLVGVQILVARYTRCQFDPWLLLSTAATAIVVVWSVTALSVSLHVAGSDASPHAVVAADLAQARVDGIQVNGDDLLTQVDHGEDCFARTVTSGSSYHYIVTCTFETQVVRYLTTPDGQLRADLARAAADAPDPPTRSQIDRAMTVARHWLSDENALPTLQNLAAVGARQTGGYLRYDRSFEQSLGQYTDPGTTNVFGSVDGDSKAFQDAVTSAIGLEWISYDQQAAGASGALAGAVTGAVLLGLLAAAVGGAGIGFRVAEYWSAGGQA